MIHTPVSSEWTSTWCWPRPEEECPREGGVRTGWEPSRRLPRRRPCSSSNRSMRD